MLKCGLKLAFLAGIAAATILLTEGAAISVSAGPQEAPVQTTEGRRVVRMHPSLAAARLTRRSEPVYPDTVKAAGISGAVLLDVTVDEHGAVEAIEPLTGYPTLLDAAAETVRHWQYLTFSEDGTAVAFKATVTVNFILTDPDTPHLWLSVDGEIGKQGSDKPLSQKDLGRQFQKSPIAVISHDPKISFGTLETSVRDLSELGLKYPQMTFFAFDEGRLYYVSRNPGDPEPVVEQPNTTQETRRELIKWKAWIEDSTPIPTPNSSFYSGVIGLFEGARYQRKGWYRPKFRCRMNYLNSPFCEVCTEALAKAICSRTGTVNSFSPEDRRLHLTSHTLRLSVTPMRPITHLLQASWYIDGVRVAGPDDSDLELEITQAGFRPGMHQLKVEVFDPTTLVRNDPEHLLNEEVIWEVQVSDRQPRRSRNASILP